MKDKDTGLLINMTVEEVQEIQEILDKDNRLISKYAEENARLKRQLAEVTKAAKVVHDAIFELDAVIYL